MIHQSSNRSRFITRSKDAGLKHSHLVEELVPQSCIARFSFTRCRSHTWFPWLAQKGEEEKKPSSEHHPFPALEEGVDPPAASASSKSGASAAKPSFCTDL